MVGTHSAGIYTSLRGGARPPPRRVPRNEDADIFSSFEMNPTAVENARTLSEAWMHGPMSGIVRENGEAWWFVN